MSKTGNKRRAPGKRGKDGSLVPLLHYFLSSAFDTIKLPRQQEARDVEWNCTATGSQCVLTSKAITKQTFSLLYRKFLLYYLEHFLYSKRTTWWFLLTAVLYGFSINLKGTKCLPWVSACHGFTWQHWIQGISQHFCGETVVFMIESGRQKSGEPKWLAQGELEIREYLVPNFLC